MAKYWIKLYTESLSDRKVVALDDHTWRRFFESLMLAGMVDRDGQLPTIDDAAWILRIESAELIKDWDGLVKIGLLEKDDPTVLAEHLPGHYWVKNFAKRQAPMAKAEYMQRLRSERHDQQYSPNPDGEAYRDPELRTLPEVTEEDPDGELPDGELPVTKGHTERKKERVKQSKDKKKEIPDPDPETQIKEFIFSLWDTDPSQYNSRVHGLIDRQIAPHPREKVIGLARELHDDNYEFIAALAKMAGEDGLTDYYPRVGSGGQDTS